MHFPPLHGSSMRQEALNRLTCSGYALLRVEALLFVGCCLDTVIERTTIVMLLLMCWHDDVHGARGKKQIHGLGRRGRDGPGSAEPHKDTHHFPRLHRRFCVTPTSALSFSWRAPPVVVFQTIGSAVTVALLLCRRIPVTKQ